MKFENADLSIADVELIAIMDEGPGIDPEVVAPPFAYRSADDVE